MARAPRPPPPTARLAPPPAARGRPSPPQVTKVARAAGAVALAPAVDRLLDGVRRGARLRSKRTAFFAVVGACVAAALLLFAGVVGADA
jgi:hypothetical protein